MPRTRSGRAAGAFFGGAGRVQGDGAEEDLLVREVGGPGVRFGDGAGIWPPAEFFQRSMNEVKPTV
jgi:hypothetical protein